jgi:hypothetical protein
MRIAMSRPRSCAHVSARAVRERRFEPAERGALPNGVQRVRRRRSEPHSRRILEPHILADDMPPHRMHVAVRALERARFVERGDAAGRIGRVQGGATQGRDLVDRRRPAFDGRAPKPRRALVKIRARGFKRRVLASNAREDRRIGVNGLSGLSVRAHNSHTVKTAGGSRRKVGDDSHTSQWVFAASKPLTPSILSDDVFGSNPVDRTQWD